MGQRTMGVPGGNRGPCESWQSTPRLGHPGPLTFVGNPKELSGLGRVGYKHHAGLRGAPEHGDFEGKVYQVMRTHPSSITSVMEPSASPSPSHAMGCRGAMSWGQRSTTLSRVWSPRSASTFCPDTVGTQAPQVMGHCPPGTRCPCSTCSSHRSHCPQGARCLESLLHSTCPVGPRTPTPLHPSTMDPDVLALCSHPHASHSCGLRCLGLHSTPHCSLPLGHSVVSAHH